MSSATENPVDPWTLALAQMSVRGGCPSENLSRAEQNIAAAAEAGAQLVLLPEALDLGWTHSSSGQEAAPIPDGVACQRLAQAARRHGLYVCAGLTERDQSRVFNAAVLLNPSGELLLHHRKLNELEIGHACYEQGDRLGVVPTELGTLGLMICADAFANGQVISRTLGLMGAQVILSPCAWAVPAEHDNAADPYGQLWQENYGPVAEDFQLTIAGCSNVGKLTDGPWAGRGCIGCSLVVGPEGRPSLQGPYGVDAETVLTTVVQPIPRPARGDGWNDLWSGRV